MNKTTNTARTTARQCGKTLAKNLERAIANMEAIPPCSVAAAVHVGTETMKKVKELPARPHTEAGVMHQMYGIPIFLNECLPPLGFAFLNKDGKVLSAGNLTTTGDQNEETKS